MSIEFTCRYGQRTAKSIREQLMRDAGFGEVFTDHMITIRWSLEENWHDAQVQPYAALSLDPATQVLHYGQQVFEALKAYRTADGGISSFRPFANACRLNNSCRRMAMPTLPEDTFVEALDLLIKTDNEWVPAIEGYSLYLRPFMLATQRTLSFYRRSRDFLFVVIASPSGTYFKGGLRPISVWLSHEYVRAARGGTGAAKSGGNYAGTLLAQEHAAEMGCDQVVWLDAKERRWVEEMGTSNLFFVFGKCLVTPKLTGTILPGVTRDSLLRLAADLGYEVREDDISIEQWRSAADGGALTEVFSCGTSSMVTPIGLVKGMGDDFSIGDGQPGPVTMRLRSELMGIQFGQLPDPYGWRHKVLYSTRALT
jgi:branched-chain amino acid aminotransferase